MRAAIVHIESKRQSRGEHPGLLLQRFLAKDATGREGDPAEKRAILQAAIEAAARVATSEFYRRAYERWQAALPKSTLQFELVTDGRLIVGLGSENVLETGITVNHTYGMPLIPGSALKGLTAHYCSETCGASDPQFRKPSNEDDIAYRKYLANEGPKPEENYHRILFGTTDDSGCIVFHEAWFVPESVKQPLVLDVMTPHHPEWLDGKAAPTDFDSPNPVPFVSAVGRFRFALSWRGPDLPNQEEKDWLALVERLLRSALEDWGVGGKTSSGYGRFKSDPELERRREAERRAAQSAAREAAEKAAFEQSLANDSEPLRQLKQMQRDQNWKPTAGDNNMVAALKKFADEHPDPPQDCLDWIHDWLESIPSYSGVWDDPDAMKGKKKDKPKYRSKSIRDLVRQLNPKLKKG